MANHMNRALRRLEGTNFECPKPPMPCGDGEVKVSETWLLIVVECLGEFLTHEEWMK